MTLFEEKRELKILRTSGNPRFLHFWGGYNPYIGGLKPSFFMVLGSKGILPKMNTFEGVLSSFFGGTAKELFDYFSATFWFARDLNEVSIGFSKPTFQIQIWAHDVWSCAAMLQQDSRKHAWKEWHTTLNHDETTLFGTCVAKIHPVSTGNDGRNKNLLFLLLHFFRNCFMK